MSDTPRTDAAKQPLGSYQGQTMYMVASEFAMQLERELAAAAARVAELERDAERYRWLRSSVSGARNPITDTQDFTLRPPSPVGNIMRGSVAQHLDAAIDAAREKARTT